MTFVWISRLPSARMLCLSSKKATPASARASRMVAI